MFYSGFGDDTIRVKFDAFLGGTTDVGTIGGRVPKGDPAGTGRRPGTFNTGWIQAIYQAEERELHQKVIGYVAEERNRPRSGRLLRATKDTRNLVGLRGDIGLRNFGVGVGNMSFLDKSNAKYWRTVEMGTKAAKTANWIGPMVDRNGVPLFGLWTTRVLASGKPSNDGWGPNGPFDRRSKSKRKVPRVPWSYYSKKRSDGKLRPFSEGKRQELTQIGALPIPYRRKHIQPMHAYRRAWVDVMGQRSGKHWERIRAGLRQQGYTKAAAAQIVRDAKLR